MPPPLFPTPSQNLRPLSTCDRFTLLAADMAAIAAQYGYTGRVPDFALSQAAHETGLFTSDLLLRANNAFGMRIAHQRPQPRIGESNGYAVYDDLRDSIADYFDRQRAFGIPNTNDPAAYIAATVASGYATSPEYAQRWRHFIDLADATDFGTAYRLDECADTYAPPVQAEAGSGGLLLLLLLALAAELK